VSEAPIDRDLTPSTYHASVGAVSIRLALPADAAGIAVVHVHSWQWAYRGLLPDSLLDGLSIVDRRTRWESILHQESAESRLWIAERDRLIVGFCGTGPSRDADATLEVPEVNAIYLERSAAGQGIGRALFSHAVSDLRERGYQAATLWVLESNGRARRFYEAAGWQPDGKTKTETLSGVDVHEVRYRHSIDSSH